MGSEMCIRDRSKETLGALLQNHIICAMTGKVNDPDCPKNFLNVRRKFVFLDGLQRIARPTFAPSAPISVKFPDEFGQSEGAVDLGGPTREYLRLALRQIYDSSNLFAGPQNSKVFILNQEGILISSQLPLFNNFHGYKINLTDSFYWR